MAAFLVYYISNRLLKKDLLVIARLMQQGKELQFVIPKLMLERKMSS